MCLEKLDKNQGYKWRTGYKIMEKVGDDRYTPECQGNGGCLVLGNWYDACEIASDNVAPVRSTNRSLNETYTAGFHVYKDKPHVVELRSIFTADKNMVIVQVECDEPLAFGEQLGLQNTSYQCGVFNKIKIVGEVKPQ